MTPLYDEMDVRRELIRRVSSCDAGIVGFAEENKLDFSDVKEAYHGGSIALAVARAVGFERAAPRFIKREAAG